LHPDRGGQVVESREDAMCLSGDLIGQVRHGQVFESVAEER